MRAHACQSLWLKITTSKALDMRCFVLLLGVVCMHHNIMQDFDQSQGWVMAGC